ncbi:MAG: alpha/beta hydrolase [Pirellulaceae bacterium]
MKLAYHVRSDSGVEFADGCRKATKKTLYTALPSLLSESRRHMNLSTSITQARLASAFLSVLLLVQPCSVAQAGRIEVIQVTSPGLRDNLLGDSATRNVTVANSVLPLFCRTLDDEEQETSSAFPTTISKEAQEFLSKGSPIPAKSPQTPEDWKDRRTTMEKMGKSLYEEGRHKYDGGGEILLFKGDEDLEVLVYKMTPVNFNPKYQEKAILHIHGGGYCLMSPESTFCVCAPVANLTGLRVYCVKYRLAPEHPYPAALDDCVTAYTTLLDTVRPENLGILGESAGATLGLTMLLKARLKKLPMPAALGCISPCVDATMSSDTITTLSGVDPVLLPKLMRTFQDAYAAQGNRSDPLLSPIRADFTKDFPPTLIQTGTRDLLLSDCVRLHAKMKAQGVNVELSLREAMWHGYHILPSNDFPEAKAAFEELAEFFRLKLGLD